LSGGSGVDPYYKKDLPTRSKKNTKRKTQSEKKTTSPQKAFNLIFDKELTQSQIAKKLGVSPKEIGKIFAKVGIEPRKLSPRDAEIAKMYYSQRMSKVDIAKKLGVSYNTVLRTFDKYGWKSIPRKTRAEPEEARKLYEKGRTQAEIAKKLGVSRHTIGNYLRQLGVEIRKPGYKTDEERQQARKEKGRRHRERVKAFRDGLFGSTCRICGVGRDKRKIAIHKKNCEAHDDKDLWRMKFLKKVNPDNWAALCVMCHRGAHWAYNEMGAEFDALEKMAKQGNQTKEGTDKSQKESKKDSQKESKTDSSSETRDDKSDLANKSVEEIRKDLFGDDCFYCGEIPSDKRLVIHKRDGEKHDDKELWDKETLMKLNPEEYEALCTKHHRYTHWAMKRLNLNWEDIASAV
jgi:DNA-binding CsgD family transcriptional regulator